MSTARLVAAAVLLPTAVSLALIVARQSGSGGDPGLDAALRPIERLGDGYASSRACRSCHPSQYQSWWHSYHRTMTQVATPESVLPAFDDVELSLYGETHRLSQRGDELWVASRPENRDGEARARRIVMSTGSHHFQLYWLETHAGRKVALFPLIYQIAERRWVPFDALMLAPPDLRQVSDQGGEWNTQCIVCHSVAGNPRARDPDAMDTQVAELGIACEACHGPGRRHVELNRNPLRRYALHLSGDPDESIVNPERLPALRAAQVCGQCHALQNHRNPEARERWLEHGMEYRPGDDLNQTRNMIRGDVAWTGVTRFWPDGRLRVHGREYPALIRSPCFRGGEYTCTDCHAMHGSAEDPRAAREWANDQLKPGMEGNLACVQCHGEFEAEDALTAHTHHPAASSGSSCYNCHMPHTVFGLQKASRDHQVADPSATESVESGRPNACNLCHLDRTLAWTAEHLEAWYGTPRPELTPSQESVAASVIWALSGEANQRALIGWHMGWEPARQASGTDWIPLYLAQLMIDPYVANRSVAYRSLRTLPGFEGIEYDYAAPRDEVRADADRVFQTWTRMRTEQRPAVLIDDAGVILEAFRELGLQRDDRMIYLAE